MEVEEMVHHPKPRASGRDPGPTWRRAALVLAVLLLPALLGGWREVDGNAINPRFVKRIKNGETKKYEILMYFGDPKEVERTPEGSVYKYYSYKDAPVQTSGREKEPIMANEYVSSQQFYLDENRNVKRVPVKKEGKILRSSLTVRFKADGETVLSHEYQEY
jgi:hypothetical protein